MIAGPPALTRRTRWSKSVRGSRVVTGTTVVTGTAVVTGTTVVTGTVVGAGAGAALVEASGPRTTEGEPPPVCMPAADVSRPAAVHWLKLCCTLLFHQNVMLPVSS